ncbi:MAG TPA: sigma-70 family RNA polymerase sigma factor, partial [Acidimicrobiia bacterium]|nr:sigma-70 family RNA polymerase sigma factor [Acidimicrobiia bacterium]
ASVALVLGDAEVAADAVNEALARAWNRVRKGHDIESLGAWIRVVALHAGYDEHRKRAAESRRYPRLITIEPGDEHAGIALSVDVREALEALPRRQREVAVLHYLYDLPVASIASELGISEGTVKTCLQRARAALHGLLQEEPEEVHWHAS